MKKQCVFPGETWTLNWTSFGNYIWSNKLLRIPILINVTSLPRERFLMLFDSFLPSEVAWLSPQDYTREDISHLLPFVCLLKTEFLCVALPVLKLTFLDQAGLDLRDPIASAGIKAMCHYDEINFLRQVLLWQLLAGTYFIDRSLTHSDLSASTSHMLRVWLF